MIQIQKYTVKNLSRCFSRIYLFLLSRLTTGVLITIKTVSPSLFVFFYYYWSLTSSSWKFSVYCIFYSLESGSRHIHANKSSPKNVYKNYSPTELLCIIKQYTRKLYTEIYGVWWWKTKKNLTNKKIYMLRRVWISKQTD